jgi:hypothetical protein
MANPGNPEGGEPRFPPPSPTCPSALGEDPLPEPRGLPAVELDVVPPANKPLGIPGGMLPEIVF